jgi:hypothetical protein
VATRGDFTGGNAAEGWSWTLTCIYSRGQELWSYISTPPLCLHAIYISIYRFSCCSNFGAWDISERLLFTSVSLTLDSRQDSLDGWSARRRAATYTGQHKHRLNANINTLNGIRTRDPSVRANEDISCLRPRGHCYRP